MEKPLLEISNLTVSFSTPQGKFNAIDDISFSINSGETVGIVGESGCGKSVTALSIMRLLDEHNSKINGEIKFKGDNLLKRSKKEMRRMRGKNISMIFQEPMTSLNPLHTVGKQIMEVYKIHENLSQNESRKKALQMLKLVGIPMPDKIIDEYPHQLSGGMRQRVMIAIALACNPQLLIADEPTTALDVTIQAQILRLMKELKDTLETSIMMITHDLGVVAQVADRIIVMYAGQIIEASDVKRLFKRPIHPYTKGLMQSIPKVDIHMKKLQTIKGMVPSLYNMPSGCRFAPRCKYSIEKCTNEVPALIDIDNRKVRCFRYEEFLNGGSLDD